MPSGENVDGNSMVNQVVLSSSYLQGDTAIVCPKLKRSFKNEKIEALIEKIKADESYHIHKKQDRENYQVSIRLDYTISLGKGTLTELEKIGMYGEKTGAFAYIYEGENGSSLYTTYDGQYIKLANIGPISFDMSEYEKKIECPTNVLEDHSPEEIGYIQNIPVCKGHVKEDKAVFSLDLGR
ncbi:MAG: hypothetical protein JW812_01040 [Alphaproteobacteria bacterium]|nr:hypothetical protein [Alphaproteobacteria bacterium]